MENTELKIFRTATSDIEIEIKLEKETIWLNQYQLEEIFETNRTTINKHISNIYRTNELEKEAICAKFAQVRKEGSRSVKRNISYYNLDVVIAVGYRVNSRKGTEFRICVNKILAQNQFIKGTHSIVWNGNDKFGKSVSSGIYYYKLNVNGKTEAVKNVC